MKKKIPGAAAAASVPPGKDGANDRIVLEGLCSMEYYQSEAGTVQVLRDIGLTARAGEIWSVIGPSVFEMRLLLEIVANARPYQKGRCRLSNIGMMRKKRMILPHVFYVGGTNSLIGNMNVLEYLMFVTAKTGEEAVARQKRLFDELLEAGLGFLSLSPIAALKPEERSIVTLFSALCTESEIIVWNLPRLFYGDRLLPAAKYLAGKARMQRRVLLLSTLDHELAQAVSTHVLFLKGGQVFYRGPARPFAEQWDRLVLTIEDPRAERFQAVFEQALPDCRYRLAADRLEIYDMDGVLPDLTAIYRVIAEHGLEPQIVWQNTPNLGNAYERIVAQERTHTAAGIPEQAAAAEALPVAAGLEEARADSGEAQADSEETQADSGEAWTDSEEAQADSGEARTVSEDAQADSGDAQADSEEAQADSEETRTDSGEAQADSEEARADSGEAQADSEETREDSGEARADSEETRADFEEARTVSDAARTEELLIELEAVQAAKKAAAKRRAASAIPADGIPPGTEKLLTELRSSHRKKPWDAKRKHPGP